VGIDVGKTKCRVAMMDERGAVADEFGFDNDHEGIDDLARTLTVDDRVVMEATGPYWLSIYERLDDMHVATVLASPSKTKAIAWARIKSEKVDARILAHLLRADLIPESYVPPKDVREMRELIRHRASLVKVRTMVKNRVHSIVDREGMKHDFSDLFGKGGTEWLRSLELPPMERLMLDNHLDHLESLDLQVERVGDRITEKASMDEDVIYTPKYMSQLNRQMLANEEIDQTSPFNKSATHRK